MPEGQSSKPAEAGLMYYVRWLHSHQLKLVAIKVPAEAGRLARNYLPAAAAIGVRNGSSTP